MVYGNDVSETIRGEINGSIPTTNEARIGEWER